MAILSGKRIGRPWQGVIMQDTDQPKYMVCRAEYLLPLAAPDRGQRIKDGYVLAEGETIKEVGPFTTDVAKRLLSKLGPSLGILGGDAQRKGEPIPQGLLICMDFG